MYCRKCGAEIKETSKFCDSCGCEVVKVKQVSYAEKYSDYYEGVLVIKGETLGKTGHIPQLISINNTHVKEAFEIE